VQTRRTTEELVAVAEALQRTLARFKLEAAAAREMERMSERAPQHMETVPAA
jgi:hypothetical protein